MKEKLIDIVYNNGTLFGVLFISLSTIIMIKKIKSEKKSFDEHNVASWEAYVNGWALIVILFIFGIILILK